MIQMFAYGKCLLEAGRFDNRHCPAFFISFNPFVIRLFSFLFFFLKGRKKEIIFFEFKNIFNG